MSRCLQRHLNEGTSLAEALQEDGTKKAVLSADEEHMIVYLSLEMIELLASALLDGPATFKAILSLFQNHSNNESIIVDMIERASDDEACSARLSLQVQGKQDQDVLACAIPIANPYQIITHIMLVFEEQAVTPFSSSFILRRPPRNGYSPMVSFRSRSTSPMATSGGAHSKDNIFAGHVQSMDPKATPGSLFKTPSDRVRKVLFDTIQLQRHQELSPGPTAAALSPPAHPPPSSNATEHRNEGPAPQRSPLRSASSLQPSLDAALPPRSRCTPSPSSLSDHLHGDLEAAASQAKRASLRRRRRSALPELVPSPPPPRWADSGRAPARPASTSESTDPAASESPPSAACPPSPTRHAIHRRVALLPSPVSERSLARALKSDPEAVGLQSALHSSIGPAVFRRALRPPSAELGPPALPPSPPEGRACESACGQYERYASRAAPSQWPHGSRSTAPSPTRLHNGGSSEGRGDDFRFLPWNSGGGSSSGSSIGGAGAGAGAYQPPPGAAARSRSSAAEAATGDMASPPPRPPASCHPETRSSVSHPPSPIRSARPGPEWMASAARLLRSAGRQRHSDSDASLAGRGDWDFGGVSVSGPSNSDSAAAGGVEGRGWGREAGGLEDAAPRVPVAEVMARFRAAARASEWERRPDGGGSVGGLGVCSVGADCS